MNYKASIGRILTEISEITGYLEKNENAVKKIPPDLIKDIKKLREWMAFFKTLNDRGFREIGVDLKQLQKETGRSAAISEEDKKIIGRAQSLENTVRRAKARAEDPEKSRVEKESEKGSKKRKKSFKTIGSDSKWIPL